MAKTGSIKFEEIPISHEEYCSGKYDFTIDRSGEKFARVTLIDGKIDPERSYSKRYLKEHGIGEFSKEKETEKEKTSKKKKSSKTKKPLWKKILYAPFKGIWWIIKKLFVVVLIGMFIGDKDKK